MLEDTISFDALWERARADGARTRAIRAFVRFMEERLGARFVYDGARIPFHKPELIDLFAIAEKLRQRGVIRGYYPSASMADEPTFYKWSAEIVSATKEKSFASGAHPTDERAALVATLAEAAERHVWFERTDYFDSPTVATVAEMRERGLVLAPERFAGFSTAQRAASKRLALAQGSRYQWVRGHSWVSGAPVWIPTQVISGNKALHAECRQRGEPGILSNSTNGLATAPSREQAVLYGALELIERDAYMVMWLGQLSLPQFDIDELCLHSSTLARLVRQCRRYQLEPRAVRMITDAPTYAVCAVVEDTTGNTPIITLGLRADRDPARAVEKALMEALRIRQTARHMLKHPPTDWDPGKKASDVGHMDRLLYWMINGRAAKLAFLTRGPVQQFAEPWEQDSDAEHLARVTLWCKARGYECASVPMTRSAGNPTPWHIEMVVMPELQPIHLSEKSRHIGGKRLAEIPPMFGYAARAEPYIDDPHPFA